MDLSDFTTVFDALFYTPSTPVDPRIQSAQDLELFLIQAEEFSLKQARYRNLQVDPSDPSGSLMGRRVFEMKCGCTCTIEDMIEALATLPDLDSKTFDRLAPRVKRLDLSTQKRSLYDLAQTVWSWAFGAHDAPLSDAQQRYANLEVAPAVLVSQDTVHMGSEAVSISLPKIEKAFEPATYDGQMVAGIPHGYGVKTYADGEQYEGWWVKGQRSGTGTYRYADGCVYQGNYLNNQRSGIGRYTWADGTVYDGEWLNGKKTGRGKIWDSNGREYEGEWLNDRYHGKGHHRLAKGGVYEGQFINNKRSGWGKFTWKSGCVYEGEWLDGRRTGKGTYIDSNGNVYEGEWLDDKRHGKGRYQFANGDVYEGEFVNGKTTEDGSWQKVSAADEKDTE